MAVSIGMTWHAKSDAGQKRPVNEDNFLLPDSTGISYGSCPGALFAVADGLGGHAGGKIASRMACDLLMDFYRSKLCREEKPLPAESLLEALEKSFYDIDTKIRNQSRTNKACENMGTTLSVLLIAGRQVLVAHVGDSRIYRLRGKELVQLTVDHNFVQEMIAEGEVLPSEAAHHPLRNMLTRTVGTEEPLHGAFTCLGIIEPGDCFLLCSDGLYSMISDTEILDALITCHGPARSVDRLLALALSNGGQDNITVIVVQV